MYQKSKMGKKSASHSSIKLGTTHEEYMKRKMRHTSSTGFFNS